MNFTHSPILFGVERFLERDVSRFKGARVGLLTHHGAVDRHLVATVDNIAAHPDLQLKALFTPEHGLYGVAQAGDKVEDEIHPRYGVPVYSLYGARKQPVPEMLAELDLLLVDYKDMGIRFYTYLSSLGYLLEAAAEQGLPVVVLDRPNPLTGKIVEGPLLDPGLISYVGRYPLPLRYGLTIGEAATWIASRLPQSVSVEVVRTEGWQRDMWYDDVRRVWVPPSPNMPTLDTAIVYPGLALLEGTNISEGRGTTKPFELFGAPWLRAHELIEAFHRLDLPGVRLREASFVPSFSKHQGQFCRGAQLHVMDRNAFQPVLTGIHLLALIARLHPEEFRWTEPVNGRHFIDLLSGTKELRQTVEARQDVTTLYKRWNREAQEIHRRLSAHFLYS
jgi:uncharacterized protein YbbC (DUF1343 family)